MKSRPVTRVGSSDVAADKPVDDAAAPLMSREDEQAVMERLRELGYIE
jgi:hypothetical protein